MSGGVLGNCSALSSENFYVPLYLRGRTIREVGGKVMIGSFIYLVAAIDGSLCFRFYGILFLCSLKSPCKCFIACKQ